MNKKDRIKYWRKELLKMEKSLLNAIENQIRSIFLIEKEVIFFGSLVKM